MKRIIGNLLALFLLLLVAVGCNNSTPNVLGEITINEGYAKEVDIEDFTKGVELPKAGITAHYTNGNAAAVTSNISYSAVKDGVAISGLTVKEKGTYTITATYKEGEVSKSASYSVTVTGPARLFVSEMEGTDNYYSGDTYKETDIKATITYEDRYGKTNTVTPSGIIVSKEDGTVVANDTELTNGNYYIVFNYTDSDGAVLSTEKENFYVSAGLLPVSFDVVGKVTIPESINKEKTPSLDLSGLIVKAYYEDGDKKAERELQIIDAEGTVEDGVSLSLTYGETTISYDNGISLVNFNKGDRATLTITVPKSLLKAVKKTDSGVVDTAYKGEGLAGNLTDTNEILITVNPVIIDGSLKVTTNEGTTEVPYVENDTVELKNITFTYDDGTGAEPYTVSADTKGVVVKKGDEAASSPFNLTLGENTISVTYNETETETTVEAVEAAKAVEITSIISALTTRYEVNSATETKISIPNEIRMKVKYEDDFEEEITVSDTSKFTFTLNWKTSLGINLLSEPITVTKDSPATLSDANVGLYDLSITYSDPGDFTHRQAKSFQENEKSELTYIYDDEIEIIQAAAITDLVVTNSTEKEFTEFVEGDVIRPSDVTFTFINIYGEKDTSKTKASDENFTLYINDSPVSEEGYTLTDDVTTYYVKYDDNSGVTATSEKKTISPLPLLTPVSVSINEPPTGTINMEDKINTPYSVDNLSVKLTYADDETKEVNVIENGKIIDESFSVKIGETPYSEFIYSYNASSLGEQTVTVTLGNPEAHSKRQVKEVTEQTAVLDDSYSITIERNPIIKEAKYTLPEGKIIYNNSRINTSDISFIYVDNHGNETTIYGNNEEVICSIDETQATDGTLTIPAEGAEVTINVSYEEIESSITISDILADEPAKLLIEDDAITTEYKATFPLFSETIADSIELEYLSEKVETIEKSDLTFKIGDSTITTETNIVKENEGSSIDVYYGEYKVYTTEAINYNAVESLIVTPKENVPLAIVQTEESVDAKAFVEKVALVFEDDTEEDYEEYEFKVSGDTDALREMVILTPSVTINGDTVVDSKNALTVQVVANKYERAGYDDVLTIEANNEIAFSIPEVFNRTKDGEAIFFLGYYDEEGTELTYGEGDIYVTTEGEAVLDATDTYPVDYTITNTIHNTKGKEVKLHPIYAPVSDYAALVDGVLTDNEELPIISSSIIGIPSDVTSISSENEDTSPFMDNTSIRLVTFEKGTQISKLNQRAFARMELKYVDLPDSVTVLGLGAFADSALNAEEAYINISKNSQLSSLGSYAFSGSNFVNIRIPSDVSFIAGATFLNSKYLSTVIIDEREKNITLQDGLFDANNNGLESIYIPANTSLSNNTFAGMSIGKIIINDRQNTSSFRDGEESAWGASGNPEIIWLIENIQTSDITDEESLKAFLAISDESVGYIKNSFSTNGFSIGDNKTLIAENSAVITLTTPVEGSKGYVVVEGDNISIENITFALDIESSDSENYLMYAANAQNLTMDNVTLDNSKDNKTTYSTGYFNNVDGEFESFKVSGDVTVPIWFMDCQITLNNYNSASSGSYDYSRFMLEGTGNMLTFTGSITGVLDRFCSTESEAANYVDFTESNINPVWTNSSTGKDGDLIWYSYKNN